MKRLLCCASLLGLLCLASPAADRGVSLAMQVSRPTVYGTVTTPGAPTATLDEAAGLVTAGTHSVKIAYVTADGTSLPSAKSEVVTADETHAKITTSLPVSAHPSVTARKVYMSAAGDAGPWKLVATVADNTTVTYQINLADANLGANAPTADTASPADVTVTLPTSYDARLTNICNGTGARLYFGFGLTPLNTSTAMYLEPGEPFPGCTLRYRVLRLRAADNSSTTARVTVEY